FIYWRLTNSEFIVKFGEGAQPYRGSHMAPYKTRCPKCDRKLILPKSGGHLRCPKCGHRFVLNGSAASYPVAAAAPAVFSPAPAAAESKPLPAKPEYDHAAHVPLDEETLAPQE